MVNVIFCIKMLFIFSTPVLFRHLCQLKTVVFLHWCIIHVVLLEYIIVSMLRLLSKLALPARGFSMRIPLLGYNVGQPPISLIVRSTNSLLDQMVRNAIICGTDFNNCRTKKYNLKNIYFCTIGFFFRMKLTLISPVYKRIY